MLEICPCPCASPIFAFKQKMTMMTMIFRSARAPYRAFDVRTSRPVRPTTTIFPEFLDELKHCRQMPRATCLQIRTKIQIQTKYRDKYKDRDK